MKFVYLKNILLVMSGLFVTNSSAAHSGLFETLSLIAQLQSLAVRTQSANHGEHSVVNNQNDSVEVQNRAEREQQINDHIRVTNRANAATYIHLLSISVHNSVKNNCPQRKNPCGINSRRPKTHR